MKPAGCAQGSKIQQIPGQLSGDSYFVNGHTEPKTLQIFENGNYRLTKLIRDQTWRILLDEVLYLFIVIYYLLEYYLNKKHYLST